MFFFFLYLVTLFIYNKEILQFFKIYSTLYYNYAYNYAYIFVKEKIWFP